jgi:hypothetical protein
VAPPATKAPAFGAALAWNALIALSILLAVLAVIVTALGVAGVDLF